MSQQEMSGPWCECVEDVVGLKFRCITRFNPVAHNVLYVGFVDNEKDFNDWRVLDHDPDQDALTKIKDITDNLGRDGWREWAKDMRERWNVSIREYARVHYAHPGFITALRGYVRTFEEYKEFARMIGCPPMTEQSSYEFRERDRKFLEELEQITSGN